MIWTGSTAARSSTTTDPGTITNLLAHPRLVWLGSIAYALYLWHWPLLIFYLAWSFQSDVTWYEGAAILAVSTLLAWLTTRYVESPLRAESSAPADPVELASTEKASRVRRWFFRGAQLRRRVLVAALVLATTIAGVTVSLWQYSEASARVDTTTLDPRHYPGARALLEDMSVPRVEPMPRPEFAYLEWPITSRDNLLAGFTDGRVLVGEYGGVNAQRTMALVGGSHSEQWITALNAIGKKRNFKVTTYLKAGCPLITTHEFTWKGKPYTQCNEWSRKVMDQLAVDQPDIVFTVGTRPAFEGDGDIIPVDYLQIFDEWRERGQQVIAVRDNPWAMQPMAPPECLSAGRSPASCGVERAKALNPVDPQLEIAELYPNMAFLDYTDAMCTDTVCPAVVGNVLVWHDQHHLTETFVRSLIPAMGADLGPATGWW